MANIDVTHSISKKKIFNIYSRLTNLKEYLNKVFFFKIFVPDTMDGTSILPLVLKGSRRKERKIDQEDNFIADSNDFWRHHLLIERGLFNVTKLRISTSLYYQNLI